MKFRLIVTAGVAAGLSVVPGLAARAVSPSGTCPGASGPSLPNGPVLPADPTGGTAPYVYSSGGDPTTGSGFIGVSGSGGYLQLGGNANPPSPSGQVSGSSTQTGLNGAASVGSSPSVCVNGNSAP
jgi:hypothetical protein